MHRGLSITCIAKTQAGGWEKKRTGTGNRGHPLPHPLRQRTGCTIYVELTSRSAWPELWEARTWPTLLATICDQAVGSLASPDVVSFDAINLGDFINFLWFALSAQVLFHTLWGNPSKPTPSACCHPGVHVDSSTKQQGCWDGGAAVWGKIRIPTESEPRRAGPVHLMCTAGKGTRWHLWLLLCVTITHRTGLCSGREWIHPYLLSVCLALFLIGL